MIQHLLINLDRHGSIWNNNRVERWKRALLGDKMDSQKPQDTCINILSLGKDAHTLWDNGRFALRPVDQPDPTRLEVEFYWQKKSADWSTRISFLAKPNSLRHPHTTGDYTLYIPTGQFDQNGHEVARPVESGDSFVLTTSDPQNLPLPSWSLLEMQWHLQHIAAMSGATEPQDYSDFDSDTHIGDPVAPVCRARSILCWLEKSADSEELMPEAEF